jgi:actin-related protein 5
MEYLCGSQESVLDCTFLRLGINTPSISHPVFMTERLASPLYCRSQTSELLFELYGAPSVCYGVDSLMAFSNLGNLAGGDGKRAFWTGWRLARPL